MTRILSLIILVGSSTVTFAHEPIHRGPIEPRDHVRLANQHPPEYRRQYNRPRDFMGRLAYIIAPSSQEAMAWHRAKHRCYYENNVGYREMQYFYPKPWEGLRVGARQQTAQPGNDGPVPTPEPLAEYELPRVSTQTINAPAQLTPSPAVQEVAPIPALER